MNTRRSFFSRFGTAVAALTIGRAHIAAERAEGYANLIVQPPETGSAKAPAERVDVWHPARYSKDDWLEQIPGKHRLFFDTLTDGGLREARGFANNYFDGSKSGYGLEQSDLAVVICLRHSATPFYKEMTANLIGNGHFVAAGIIAVNRAQERGYSIAYSG
jgi:hypothetical protein